MSSVAPQQVPGLPPLPPAQQQQQAVAGALGQKPPSQAAVAGEGGNPAAGDEPKKAS